MPIQFHCQHCRQLLGISRSRAGSVVDCPACGRSLRVPTIDGAVARAEPVPTVDKDARFLNALEELSGLPHLSRPLVTAAGSHIDTSATPVARRDKVELPPPRARQRRAGRSTEADSELLDATTGKRKDSIRIVPLVTTSAAVGDSSEDVLRELAELPAEEDWAPQIVPEFVEPERLDEPVAFAAVTVSRAVPSVTATSPRPAFDLPDHLSVALEELAGIAVPETPLSSLSATRPPLLIRWIMMTVVLVIGGTAAGFLWGRSGASAGLIAAASTGDDESQPARDNPAKRVEDVPPGALAPVSGIVRYTDGSGELRPDAGALVLLLPTANTSGLRLDARPLRDGQSGTSKVAVEAALAILGATITRVAGNGTFSVTRRQSGMMELLIVSRHAARPDVEPVAPELMELLSEWFDAPNHITGRLTIKRAEIAAVSDVGKSAFEPIEFSM